MDTIPEKTYNEEKWLPTRKSTLECFQKKLSMDEDQKEHFISAGTEEPASDSSESEAPKELKIVAARKRKRTSVNGILMDQLIEQQVAYLKSQKRLYKLQKNIDVEEVKTRYIKLDLNNAQVKISDLEDSVKEYSLEFLRAKSEVWVMRVLIFVYLVYRILF